MYHLNHSYAMKCSRFAITALACFAVLAWGTPEQAQGQRSLVSIGFEPVIVEQEVPFQTLGDALKKHTRLEARTQKETARVQFVYGIVHGKKMYGPYVSSIVELKPEGAILGRRSRTALASPWDAFDDPLLGFEDPILGFDDPLVGFDDPLFGAGDPRAVVNHEEQYSTPGAALGAIWGNGNIGLEKDEYALVLFSMNAEGERAPVQHAAMVVPFRVTEGGGRTLRRP